MRKFENLRNREKIQEYTQWLESSLFTLKAAEENDKIKHSAISAEIRNIEKELKYLKNSEHPIIFEGVYGFTAKPDFPYLAALPPEERNALYIFQYVKWMAPSIYYGVYDSCLESRFSFNEFPDASPVTEDEVKKFCSAVGINPEEILNPSDSLLVLSEELAHQLYLSEDNYELRIMLNEGRFKDEDDLDY